MEPGEQVGAHQADEEREVGVAEERDEGVGEVEESAKAPNAIISEGHQDREHQDRAERRTASRASPAVPPTRSLRLPGSASPAARPLVASCSAIASSTSSSDSGFQNAGRAAAAA